MLDPVKTYRPHRLRELKGTCRCRHEDWQHGVGQQTCAGGATANSCPCTASWREIGWSQPEREAP